jgi:ribosomal protein S18 acetylase RimI-like enzyme
VASIQKGWTTEANILEVAEPTRDGKKSLQSKKHDAKIYREQSDYRLCLLVRKEQELYLGMLTVSPELQNSGLGKKLLQQAEVHAQVGLA